MESREQINQILIALKAYEDILYTVNETIFDEIALSLFYVQAEENKVYSAYLAHLGVSPKRIKRLEDIPFLPISFFKNKHIISGSWKEEATFLSSGTTGSNPGQHKVKALSFYYSVAHRIFRSFYGSLNQFHFLAYLPSHTLRGHSSLVMMIDYFIRKSCSVHSGFYMGDEDRLCTTLSGLKKSSKKIILWGVSFALMDLAEKQKLDLSHCIVMETGGMKGKRDEIIREDLHAFLCERFNVKQIHSEYGMTELLSQAYSQGGGYFQTPPWMKILIRDINDPFDLHRTAKGGGINIVDLANIYTCAFIETQDLGRIRKCDFEVLGRFDHADIRGCNLLME